MKHRVRILAASVGACVLVIGASVGLSARRAHRQDDKMKARNEEYRKRLDIAMQTLDINDVPVTFTARSFTVAARERHAGSPAIRLTMRNDYSKSITAFAIAWGTLSERLVQEQTMGTRDLSILPGSTEDVLLDLNDPDLVKGGIEIQAVLFDDGTADGSPSAVREMVQYREGELLQVEHTLGLLREVSGAPDLAAAIKAAQSDLQGPPPGSIVIPGSGIDNGASLARSGLTHFLKNISANIDAGKASSGLPELIDFLGERSSQLKAFLVKARPVESKR
jgi:hypothetical protein